MKRVLMVAAENGALSGAKVGGMADVIRDLPAALYAQGVCSDVIMPSYGFLHRQQQAHEVTTVVVNFYGAPHWVTLYQCAHPTLPEVSLYFLDHPLFDDEGRVYSPSDPERPFAEDANKFALFGLAVAQALVDRAIAVPDFLHLHDWHCGVLAWLRSCSMLYRTLLNIPAVLTIHNLAIQGTRPLALEHSSLQSWFPQCYADQDEAALNKVRDPRYLNCFNPLRAAIVLSDRVHLVSPSYAQEVLRPSCRANAFIGGEGLEADLAVKQQQGALFGILNGCDYPAPNQTAPQNLAHKPKSQRKRLINCAEQAIQGWLMETPWVRSVDQVALMTLARLRRETEDDNTLLLTSVGRLTDQKMAILCYRDSQGVSTLEHLLKGLEGRAATAVMVILGSGDPAIENQLAQLAAKHHNLLFINGFSLELSEVLYKLGNLFIMPSSFEPCGISQMLAMRAGQPCLVHGVGGLKDTVIDGEDGFVFYGDDLPAQASALLAGVERAVASMESKSWRIMCQRAADKRFSWATSASAYNERLYRK